MRLRLLLLSILAAGAANADSLRVEKTDRVGRIIENEFFIADLSHRVTNGREEDSGTLQKLTYKQFGLTLFRNPSNGRIHKGVSLQRVGASSYKDIGSWDPVQVIREEQKSGIYTHHREGYFADYPEVKIVVDYRFFAGEPYFLVDESMTVEKPLKVTLLRSNEMTMNLFFTHVAWPGRNGQQHIATFEERRPILAQEPMPANVPWLAFLNLEKGYGYGFVLLDYRASKEAHPETKISDGVQTGREAAESKAKAEAAGQPFPGPLPTGKYWSRYTISGQETDLVPGDRFKELSAYVLFRVQKDKPLREFLDLSKKIQNRHGGMK